MFGFTWLFCLAFYCWYCMFLTECKVVIVIDSSSSEGHGGLLPSLRSHCSDRIKNKDETDIDCGGGKCSKCNDRMMCKADCDCISDICRENKCIPLVSCKDNIRNQDESDVDCGGTNCPKCNDTMICKINCDCLSGICRENKCIHIGSCGDKIKNQDESDVDCGGIKCPKCEDGKTCNRSSDCISDFCKNNQCSPSAAESCTDNVKNQDETDVDCGGTKCTKCGNTKRCIQASDCISGSCTNNVCVPSCRTVAGSPTGSSGSTAELLNTPFGVYVDSAGNVYVADTNNNRTQKWAPGATSGITVAGSPTGSSGDAAEVLNSPRGVYIDSAGNVYVADTGNKRIQKWAPGATSGIIVAGTGTGQTSNGAEVLNSPSGVYVDSAGNVYVADNFSFTNRVQKWVPGAMRGSTVAGSSFGSSGSTAELLKGPSGVYVDSAGNVYVADTGNNRTQKWAPGATSGSTVAGDLTGSAGVTAELLSGPSGVYVDSAGNVYVADTNNNRIQKWAPGATSGITVAGSPTGSFGSTAALLKGPSGVYVDSAGNVYVADTSNNRIQKCA